MDVLSYLSELIQTRKAVGISGLGTVYKKKIPGRYDAETHSFIPPSYTLDFTDEIKEDSLLASFIGTKRNVSIDTAIYFINEFSTEIQSRLDREHSINFGELGKLVKSGNKITFEPAESINYGFDFYGLPVVKDEQEKTTPEISTENIAVEEPLSTPEEEPTLESVTADNDQTEENPGDTPAADPIAAELAPEQEEVVPEVKEPVEENPFAQYKKNEQQLREEIESLNFYRSKSPYLKSTGPGDEEVIMKLNKISAREDAIDENSSIDPFPVYPAQAEEQKTMPAYLKILISIGILALMMGIVYQIKPDVFNGLTGKAPAKKLSTSAAKPGLSAVPNEDTLTTDSIQKNGASLSPADTLINTLPATPVDTATVYEIIGASMHDQKEADNFIALMKKSGIDAKVVTNMSGRRLKMSIATLKDEKSAKEELDRLSKKLKIPGIYIYRNKQK
ncbi:hypothetical protein OQY15_12645 [Pedobacter sp. MC2016-15]|uniref:hypothetical protein n=1 Tax=Pedobacter sp. MC2016-15 TaxID=2994473 RepID=UPI002247296C|nr:hypothetical protein [Pedobacter sp. MC2016-15]MCX2479941.1 hypothetical protein [Pedobacter sp. MC2016-15]